MGFDERIFRIKQGEYKTFHDFETNSEELYFSNESIIYEFFEYHDRYIPQGKPFLLVKEDLRNLYCFICLRFFKDIVEDKDIEEFYNGYLEDISIKSCVLILRRLKEIIDKYDVDYNYYYEFY